MGETTNREQPLSHAVEARRTTPHFDCTPIPECDLHRILRTGLQAPSGYNLQPWRFVVIESAEQKAKLKVAAMNQTKVEEASAIIVACGDVEAWRRLDAIIEIARQHGINDETGFSKTRSTVTASLTGQYPDAGGFNGDPLVWVNRQVMIALTTMMWMAETLGYDTALMEGFSTSAVHNMLNLPVHIQPVALLALGRLRGADKLYTGRLPVEQTCFRESWGNELRFDLWKETEKRRNST